MLPDFLAPYAQFVSVLIVSRRRKGAWDSERVAMPTEGAPIDTGTMRERAGRGAVSTLAGRYVNCPEVTAA